MKTITLDIETTQPDWIPPEDDPNRFASLPYHVPCVISWLDSTEGDFSFHTYSMDHCDESEALVALSADLRNVGRLVTWNGRGFDMPLLNLRAMVHGIDWSFWPGMSHRYANYKRELMHYDLMDLLGDQGGCRTMPLDGVAKLLGLPGKHDICGKDVPKIWAEDPGRVARYCEEDVMSTYLVYLRRVWLMEGFPQAKEAWNRALEFAAERFGAPWDDNELLRLA